MMRLIDADALDAAFTGLRFSADRTLAHWGDRPDWCLHGSEVEKLIENAPTVGGWISVKDKLPGKLQNVLVSLVNEIDGHRLKDPQIGYHTDDAGHSWFIASWNEWAIDSDFMVTHWAPMPEGPKEAK